LPKQSVFLYKSNGRVVVDIESIQNVPKDLLGQAGESVGIYELLRFDPRRCKLGLDEAEPNVRFLLIVGTKLDLSSCCCSDRHRWASTSALMSAISDIDNSYSDIGKKNVGLNPFIPISE
jgi:hypothetical protein